MSELLLGNYIDLEKNQCNICFNKENFYLNCKICNNPIGCKDCIIKISIENPKCPYCRDDITKILIKKGIITKPNKNSNKKCSNISLYIYNVFSLLFYFILFILVIFIIIIIFLSP